ncbi:3'-5' exonuclease [Rhizobium leguminosarum]|uniref:3'-5' exonuclease n=1 Tax=Rhizobium leguminosarum TaxID=384 RepID=UPI00140F6D5F|nr:3'-5' exonuclease [Rhizobium leguminosarum]QIO64822.1 3'-5' exonuclease [Rhizobium leguminosarum bv. trifolii]
MDIAPLSVFRLCDTETTGFPPRAEMCEIGWVDFVLYPDGWKIDGEHQSRFVNPGHPIPAKCTEIHGITDDMVVDGMDPNEARAFLSRGAAVLGAHNAAFDKQFVRSALPWICTLECARHVWPQAPNHKNETLKEFLGITVDGDAHRAGYDAAVSAGIFLQLIKHLTIEEMLALSDPGAVPLKMPFGVHKGSRFTEIPDSYLKFIVGSDMRKGVKAAAQNEISRRTAAKPSTPAARSRSSSWDRSF